MLCWHRLAARDDRNHVEYALSLPALTHSGFLPLAFLNFLLLTIFIDFRALFVDRFSFRYGFFSTIHLLCFFFCWRNATSTSRAMSGSAIFISSFCNRCWGDLDLLNELF